MIIVKRNYGFDNEWDFFNYLNGKKVGEVNIMFRKFLLANFPYINNDMKISAYVNFDRTKEDIWIRVGKVKKSISIKMGKCNTVHNEYIYNFTDFLERQNVPMKIINDILDYHFLKESSVSVNANNIIEKITLNIYKQKYHKKINNINLYFQNNESLLKKLINRFVIGKNDLIIHGTVENFSYITKEEIIKVLLANKIMDSSSVHFSHLYFQAKSRKDEVMRFFFQIKWYKLEEDISIMRQKKEH